MRILAMVCALEEHAPLSLSIMTNQSELDLAQLQAITGGAAYRRGFCIDPLEGSDPANPGKAVPKWLEARRSVFNLFDHFFTNSTNQSTT